jgi:hypothetical protein
MRLKMKNVDWKKLMLEKGERIALYACLGIMGLMLVFSGKGLFFSGSATENAKKLEEQNNDARRKIAESKPTDAQLKEYTTIPDDLKKSAVLTLLDPDPFRDRAVLFLGERTEDTKRRAPKLLGPVEYAAAFTEVQVPVYIFDKEKQRVMVLRNVRSIAGGQQAAGDDARKAGKRLGELKNKGFTTGPPGRPPFVPPRSEGPGQPPRPEDTNPLSAKQETKTEFITFKELETKVGQDARLAEDILPLRMVIVAGSFPLRKQVEKFKDALRLQYADQVFALGTDGKPQFRFTGLNIERRMVDADGKPLSPDGRPAGPDGGWMPLNVDELYRPLVVETGWRFADEKPDLSQLAYPGLVMARPPYVGQTAIARVGGGMGSGFNTGGFREGLRGDAAPAPGPAPARGERDLPGQPGREGGPEAKEDPYPQVERQLQTLQSTLAELAKQAEGQPTQSRLQSRFRADDFSAFNPFAPREEEEKSDSKQSEKPREQSDWQPPEYCLIRFLDVDLTPGATYEYRLQVRMANPNYKNPNVAWPALANDKELISDWFEVRETDGGKIPDGPMLRVAVPPDSYFYVLDRADAGKNQALVQYHRWVDYIKPPGSPTPYSVADWIVADKVPVYRGEYMRRLDDKVAPKVDVPIWLYTQYDFVLATNSAAPRYEDQHKVPLEFRPGTGDYLLVDFQGGKDLRHTKTVGEKTTTVSDRAPTELIYLSPDGKLLVKDSETDRQDPKREQRVRAYEQRIKAIKEAAKRKFEELKKPLGGGDRGG